jgi:transcriptional regulator with XRE-family HTH domain
MPVKVRRIVKQEVERPGRGGRIKAAREASDRSLQSLAKEAGVSRNYWYQLEAEAVMGGVSEDTLRKIEQVLNVDFGVKFGEDC